MHNLKSQFYKAHQLLLLHFQNYILIAGQELNSECNIAIAAPQDIHSKQLRNCVIVQLLPMHDNLNLVELCLELVCFQLSCITKNGTLNTLTWSRSKYVVHKISAAKEIFCAPRNISSGGHILGWKVVRPGCNAAQIAMEQLASLCSAVYWCKTHCADMQVYKAFWLYALHCADVQGGEMSWGMVINSDCTDTSLPCNQPSLLSNQNGHNPLSMHHHHIRHHRHHHHHHGHHHHHHHNL